jgi:hypothetical protein
LLTLNTLAKTKDSSSIIELSIQDSI